MHYVCYTILIGLLILSKSLKRLTLVLGNEIEIDVSLTEDSLLIPDQGSSLKTSNSIMLCRL